MQHPAAAATPLLRQRYQTLATLSRRMCDAARAGDWDTLTQLGPDYGLAVDAVAHAIEARPRDDAERLTCMEQLAQILAHDRQTTALAQQQLSRIREHLDSTRQSRRLHRSYGRLQPQPLALTGISSPPAADPMPGAMPGTPTPPLSS